MFTPWHLGEAVVSGIFAEVMRDLMRFCCPKSNITYGQLMTSLLEVEKHFGADMQVDMAFPVHGKDILSFIEYF